MTTPEPLSTGSRTQNRATIPEFLRVVVADEKPASARAVAEQAVLALNSSMMRLYEESLEKFKQNMRDRVPIILALFTGQGGQMILYRPGHAPEVAPPVPIVYQLAKSVGHSSMAIYQIVAPYLANPAANQLWRAPLQVYRTQNQSALDSLGVLDMSEDDRAVLRAILERNLAFMDECLTKGTYTYEGLEKYIRGCTPYSVKTIGIGASAQVGHWMKVVEDWKKKLGKDWEQHLRRQQHAVHSAPEQHPVHRPRPVHGDGDDGRSAAAHRDAGVRDHPREDARRPHAHRRRPRTRHGLLPGLLPHGRRAARRRRPPGDRAGDAQARLEAPAADPGAVPFQRLALEDRPDEGHRPCYA